MTGIFGWQGARLLFYFFLFDKPSNVHILYGKIKLHQVLRKIVDVDPRNAGHPPSNLILSLKNENDPLDGSVQPDSAQIKMLW